MLHRRHLCQYPTFAVVSVHRGWVWVVRVRLYFLAPVYSWC